MNIDFLRKILDTDTFNEYQDFNFFFINKWIVTKEDFLDKLKVFSLTKEEKNDLYLLFEVNWASIYLENKFNSILESKINSWFNYIDLDWVGNGNILKSQDWFLEYLNWYNEVLNKVSKSIKEYNKKKIEIIENEEIENLEKEFDLVY